MANFADGSTKIAAWINSSLGNLDLTDEMLMVPLSGIDSAADMKAMLADLTGFVPTSTGEADATAGTYYFNSKRCVDDALRDLSSGLISVADMTAAIDARAQTHVEGKTVLVKTPMGQLLVDKAVFAAKSGLPIERSLDGAFAVSVHTVANKNRPGEKRKVFVATRMQSKSASESGNASVAAATMAAFMPKLEERSRSGFDTLLSYNLDGISSAEQFATTPGFLDVLGWMRGGNACRVGRNRDGGLYMSY
jgi:hypothetical protein